MRLRGRPFQELERQCPRARVVASGARLSAAVNSQHSCSYDRRFTPTNRAKRPAQETRKHGFAAWHYRKKSRVHEYCSYTTLGPPFNIIKANNGDIRGRHGSFDGICESFRGSLREGTEASMKVMGASVEDGEEIVDGHGIFFKTLKGSHLGM